ncbi:L-rhamnose mutarotase [Bacillus chungangensis]|uniref:L-rhamnose mutarotase n=1 Tax=Bacillus chungangensis TaxID=587633 RepID=A0ABT9WY22_9BACI|nr:L-rhamnose mutarotase [Bacillus chungangensis]MDQ0178024.1 L-rhamnose mutarotase [Bacillus chungangensis]
MIRKASVMFVYKECYEEYKRRHDELWPEMAAALKAHGAHNYSIFLDEETGRLYAYLEIEDEKKWADMAKTEVCQKWWAYMEPLMETNQDNSPVSVELKEVFYLQ